MIPIRRAPDQWQGDHPGFRGRGRGRGPLGVARGRGLLSGTPSRGRGCSGFALSPTPPGSGSGFPDPEYPPWLLTRGVGGGNRHFPTKFFLVKVPQSFTVLPLHPNWSQARKNLPLQVARSFATGSRADKKPVQIPPCKNPPAQ